MTAKDIRFDWKLEIHFMKIQRRYNRFHSRHRNLVGQEQVEKTLSRQDQVEETLSRQDQVEETLSRKDQADSV